ncbi:MAG: hypothetical protein ABIA21_03320, partial [Candidatus Aenigmatarchaeota archaeon]
FKFIPDWKSFGKCVLAGPLDQHAVFNLTGPPGCAAKVYYGFLFQLRKWEYNEVKADEWIEVSPTHAQYYQLTMKQKEDLENKIKAGLASASQSIADFELLRHDQRKYQEFKDYIDSKDEHSLRAVFIDQVDVHTGDTAIRNIVTRWPTLIVDFMRMAETDLDPGKVMDRLGVSKAEAVVLITKNKLYNEWKKIFIPEIEKRLNSIKELIQSREMSVKQYREWLKPYITRHKLLKETLGTAAMRKDQTTQFVPASGQASSSSTVNICAWKWFPKAEFKKRSGETDALHPIDPYDNWMKEELIYNKKHGLIADFPWITPDWVDATVKDIKSGPFLKPNKLYYSFFDIHFMRNTLRQADGSEVEDALYFINNMLMSQNILLAKILEIKAKEEETERYVDELIGTSILRDEEKKKKEEAKKKEDEKKWWKKYNTASTVFEKIKKIEKPKSLKWFKLFKSGPYESHFDDRVVADLRRIGQYRYAPAVALIKERFGFGQV